MTSSPFNSRQRNEPCASSAFCADDILPAGRPVVVGIPYADKKPAVTIRYYQSAPCVLPAPRRGREASVPRALGHPFAGLTHRQLWGAVQRFTPNALRLPTLPRGRRDMFLGLNLFGPFQAARRFFCTLRQFRQEPRSVFTISFRPCLSVRFIHVPKHGASDVEKIREVVWRNPNVVR